MLVVKRLKGMEPLMFFKNLISLALAMCLLSIKKCRGVLDNLPADHFQYHTRGQGLAQLDQSASCIDRRSCKVLRPCWGYEDDCSKHERYSNPTCTVHHKHWAKTLEKQKEIFFGQGDFGYVKKHKQQMLNICEAKQMHDSALRCSENMVFCRAKNLYIDFTNLKSEESGNRYREDVFRRGEIGGHCELNKALLLKQGERKSPLQSWYAELEQYTSLPFKPLQSGQCDVVIQRPSILIKLDAGVNMYHHFCDFINIYASQHINGSFTTNVNIIMWDTSSMPYQDLFAVTWKAFTRHPIIRLHQFDGKKVCFKDAVFPLLARMMFGLYYNMPLMPGCHGSGLFKAFSQHILHRLAIKQIQTKKIRVTLLVRRTKYRRILNEDKLIKAIRNIPEYELKVIDYNRNVPFLQQLNNTYNTDVFIGIHGSGLTHVLFLPDWAVLFELYNTEDPDCYRDLANLRGVSYITWENKDKLYQEDEGHHPSLGAHAKFTNYAFEVDEFMRLLDKARRIVDSKEQMINKDE